MRLSFTASNRPEAQETLAALVARYGNASRETADVLIAIGGDDFMLETLAALGDHPLPVYGINKGTVGFLMNTPDLDTLPDSINQAIEQPINPLLVEATTTTGTQHFSPINDVSLLRSSPQAANLAIAINGAKHMEKLVCDGIIVSTPAGSTAYNASVGGPILPINANVLAISPIAAFRPRRWKGAVLPMDARITITVLDADKRPVMLSADAAAAYGVRALHVKVDTARAHRLLFDANHSLERRILQEQFL